MTNMWLHSRAIFFIRIDKKTAPEMNQTIVNPKDFGENTQGNNTRHFKKLWVTQPMTKNVLVKYSIIIYTIKQPVNIEIFKKPQIGQITTTI